MNGADRRLRGLAADIREMLDDARRLRRCSARARRLAAEMLGYLRGARDYERLFSARNWGDIEATLSRARVLRERLLREATDIERSAGRRRGAAEARASRSATREILRDKVIKSARARKGRNRWLSKAQLSRLCAMEYDSHDDPLTAETVRGWLKNIDL